MRNRVPTVKPAMPLADTAVRNAKPGEKTAKAVR